MRRTAILLALLGLALATGLILFEGWRAVLGPLSTAGIGLVWAGLFHVAPMVLNARGWQLLLPRRRGADLGFFSFLVWVREAVDGLLPVARVGGLVASARLMVRGGVPLHLAVASLVVDTTVSLVTQFFFTLGGLALLALRSTERGEVSSIAGLVLLAIPLIVAFVVVQRMGLFQLGARLASLVLPGEALVAAGENLDRTLRRLYRRRSALLRSAAWQLVGWAAGAGEIYLALAYLGRPGSVWDSLVLQALTLAVGSAFFVVPGALGVQEAGFVVVGRLLGLSPTLALALALARRVRDLLVFGPGLFAWQWAEVRAQVER